MFIVIIEPLPIVLFVLPYFKWNSTFFLIKIVNLTRTLSEEDSSLMTASLASAHPADQGRLAGKDFFTESFNKTHPPFGPGTAPLI